MALLATDLSSAYDLCSHALLKEKCRLLSLGKDGLKWLDSFLVDRYQYVEIGGYKSGKLTSGNYGVIQGGPSSGELFNIFLNDLPDQVNMKQTKPDMQDSVGNMFIDDLTVVTKANNEKELMIKVKEDYLNVEKYLINNKMAINPDKTQMMILKNKKISSDASFLINQTKIINQSKMKILGVTLTPDLTFNTHLFDGKKSMSASLNTKIAMIKNAKPFLPKKRLAQVGASLLNSTILYAAPLWGTTNKTNIAKIQKLQTRGARTVEGKNWNRKATKTHRQVLLDNLNWPNVEQMITSATLNITKKALNKESSTKLNETFSYIKPRNPRATTSTRITHKGNHARKENIFSTQAVKLFNDLPPILKDPTITSKKFKVKLKKHTRTTNLLTQH